MFQEIRLLTITILTVAIVSPGNLLFAEPAVEAKLPPHLSDRQQRLFLPVRVVDQAGKPLAGAVITPWALRSSQGHGQWRDDPKERSELAPIAVTTDDAGIAAVGYPKYRDAEERTGTLSVSLWVDHPNFVFIDDLHIDLPLETKGPYEIMLQRGGTVEIIPQLNGKPLPTENLFAITSEGRSWKTDYKPDVAADGAFRFKALPPGPNSIRLVRLDGETATHFSQLLTFDLQANNTLRQVAKMQPAVVVKGRLSQTTMPVRDGRVKAWTLKAERSVPDCRWITWAPVDPEGNFSFNWPANELAQIIALSKDSIATSGSKPAVVVDKVRDPDPFLRAHVFSPAELQAEVTIPMTPLVPCEIQTVDAQGNPLEDVGVVSSPNVGWWNGGSQIYCSPLIRGEKLLQVRKYYDAADRENAAEFRQKTNAEGYATLYLPPGKKRDIVAYSDEYELPVSFGRRSVRLELIAGETARLRLVMQPKGTETLGEWDKLAGVVFGCSTRDGKRICASPWAKAKLEEFAELLAEADNPRDPVIMASAYLLIAETLEAAGDLEEGKTWRAKAAKQQEIALGIPQPRKVD